MKTLKIGILGLGTVGGGAYTILTENHDLIAARTGCDVQVTRILDVRRREGIPDALYTEDPDDVLLGDADVIVETLGGIEPAATFMRRAMEAGKHVVTANKAAVAANYPMLTKAAEENGVKFLFEASVGGGIPVLTCLRGALQGNRFLDVMGILNGTTNYILTRMTEEGADYAAVLKDAQAKGFAEADPTADVEGIDVANKLSILIALCFDRYIPPQEIPTTGISAITRADIEAATAAGCRLKLIAHAAIDADGHIETRIEPERIPLAHPLACVSDEFNAVYVTGDMVGELMFYGKGAGALPTGSAIVGDILQIARG